MNSLKKSSIILTAVILLIFSCKKGSKSSGPNIAGTYSISKFILINADGTTTSEPPGGCDTTNYQVFAANYGFTNTNTCSTAAALGSWAISNDTLIITLTDGHIYSKGIIENLTSTGFTTDENAANFAKDKVVFVKR